MFLTTETDYICHLNIWMRNGENALKSYLIETGYGHSFKKVIISFRWSDLLDETPVPEPRVFTPVVLKDKTTVKIDKKSVDRIRRSIPYCVKHCDDIKEFKSSIESLYDEKKSVNPDLTGKTIIHPNGDTIFDQAEDVSNALLQFEEDIKKTSDFVLSNKIEEINQEIKQLTDFVIEIKTEMKRVIDALKSIETPIPQMIQEPLSSIQEEESVSENVFSVDEKIDELQVTVDSETVSNVSKGGEFFFSPIEPINKKLNISIFPVWVQSWSDENEIARYKIEFCSGEGKTHIHYIPNKPEIIKMIKSLTSGNDFTYFQGIPVDDYTLSNGNIIFSIDGKEHTFKCNPKPTENSKLFLKVGYTTQKLGVTKAPVFANFPLLCQTYGNIQKSSTESIENLIRFINTNGSSKLDFKIHYSPIFYDQMSKIARSTNINDFIHSDMMEAPECVSNPTSTKETIISFFRTVKGI